jgi:hypothetical protein
VVKFYSVALRQYNETKGEIHRLKKHINIADRGIKRCESPFAAGVGREEGTELK